mgnify:CR=1 FL=1
MNTNHNAAGTFFPHQMSKDEFADWWNSVSTPTASSEAPEKAPQIIYLGQDRIEEADSL